MLSRAVRFWYGGRCSVEGRSVSTLNLISQPCALPISESFWLVSIWKAGFGLGCRGTVSLTDQKGTIWVKKKKKFSEERILTAVSNNGFQLSRGKRPNWWELVDENQSCNIHVHKIMKAYTSMNINMGSILRHLKETATHAVRNKKRGKGSSQNEINGRSVGNRRDLEEKLKEVQLLRKRLRIICILPFHLLLP